MVNAQVFTKLIIIDMHYFVYAILIDEGVSCEMEGLLALNEKESSWLSSEIKKFRGKYIKTPNEYLEKIREMECVDFSNIKTNVSQVIEDLRENCWNLYLQDEAIFNQKFIAHLIKSRELPNSMLNECIKEFDICNSTNFVNDLSDLIGEYAGSIMPYLYALDLSTTNSRRSRSGKTFEAIIKFLIKDIYGYKFDDQSNVGEGFFQEQGIGKIVDGIVPNKECYIQNRAKTIIITMKTSLRERWQEVAEEMRRTNIPQIYLLTVDEGLTSSKLKTMAHQNIYVVNYDSVKAQFKEHNNIMSFTEFFNNEIPHCLDYWERQS